MSRLPSDQVDIHFLVTSTCCFIQLAIRTINAMEPCVQEAYFTQIVQGLCTVAVALISWVQRQRERRVAMRYPRRGAGELYETYGFPGYVALRIAGKTDREAAWQEMLSSCGDLSQEAPLTRQGFGNVPGRRWSPLGSQEREPYRSESLQLAVYWRNGFEVEHPCHCRWLGKPGARYETPIRRREWGIQAWLRFNSPLRVRYEREYVADAYV